MDGSDNAENALNVELTRRTAPVLMGMFTANIFNYLHLIILE